MRTNYSNPTTREVTGPKRAGLVDTKVRKRFLKFSKVEAVRRVLKNLKTAPSLPPISPPPIPAETSIIEPLHVLLVKVDKLREEHERACRRSTEIRAALFAAAYVLFRQAEIDQATADALKKKVTGLGYEPNRRSSLAHFAARVAFPHVSPTLLSYYTRRMIGANEAGLGADEVREIALHLDEKRGGISSLPVAGQNRDRQPPTSTAFQLGATDQPLASKASEGLDNRGHPGEDSAAPARERAAPLDDVTNALSAEPSNEPAKPKPNNLITLNADVLNSLAGFGPKAGDKFVLVIELTSSGAWTAVECLGPPSSECRPG